MKPNILLMINDCLRYDRVTPHYMPFLASYAQQATTFTNYWSTSHCTDPSLVSLLGGVWPDEIGLYSMFFEQPDYVIPENVTMLSQLAKQCGYHTGFATNLGRWYTRGVDDFMDVSQFDNQQGTAFKLGLQFAVSTPSPWLLIIHDASCHAHYRGGSYDAACRAVDTNLAQLLPILKDALVVITADHGEDLFDHGIPGHGGGMWPTITHIPLIIHSPKVENPLKIMTGIQQHVELHDFLERIICGEAAYFVSHSYAHIVGRIPNAWHRAVTDGKRMLFKEHKDGQISYHLIDVATSQELPLDMTMWAEARAHASHFGMDADTGLGRPDDDIIAERLRLLGYFG